tara:strand:- start:18150 stop:19229 length:1080 start_codon:yes stop_codon:yes gene_type:complete
MTDDVKKILFSEAISEALVQSMEIDSNVFIMGAGVDDAKGLFGTTLNAFEKFGGDRVFDIPLSENTITGVAVGSSLSGTRPVLVHARNDFLMLTMDQIVNNAAKWRYMSGGRTSCPITIRAIIGRGWGQAAQHSQSFHSMFAQVPGLKVVMPSNPKNVKGLLLSSIFDDSPVIFLEHRWLYGHDGNVPQSPFYIPLGKAAKLKEGSDLTIVAFSLMASEALKAAETVLKEKINVEVIDLQTIQPWDQELVLESVAKTRRLLVLDQGSLSFGVNAEIHAKVSESLWNELDAPIYRLALPDIPTPCSPALEKIFYFGQEEIVSSIKELFNYDKRTGAISSDSKKNRVSFSKEEKPIFQGPF